MKRAVVFILVCFLLISVACDGNKYIVGYEKKTHFIYEVLYGTEVNMTGKTEEFYDDDGREILYKSYNKKGEMSFYRETAYDESGNKSLETVLAPDGNLINKVEYVYNSDGGYVVKKYNENGNVISEQAFCEDGAEKAFVEYDDYGNEKSNRVYRYEYDENGNKIFRYIGDNEKPEYAYTYDEKNNMLSETYYVDGEVFSKIEFSYDERGNVLTEGGMEYTYDENDNVLTEIKYESEDTIAYRIENVYDKNGNKLTTTFYNADGSVGGKTEYTYTDDDCNMVSVNYFNGRVVSKVEGFYENAVYGKKEKK